MSYRLSYLQRILAISSYPEPAGIECVPVDIRLSYPCEHRYELNSAALVIMPAALSWLLTVSEPLPFVTVILPACADVDVLSCVGLVVGVGVGVGVGVFVGVGVGVGVGVFVGVGVGVGVGVFVGVGVGVGVGVAVGVGVSVGVGVGVSVGVGVGVSVGVAVGVGVFVGVGVAVGVAVADTSVLSSSTIPSCAARCLISSSVIVVLFLTLPRARPITSAVTAIPIPSPLR